MNKVKIITDSCADLSGDQLEQYDIDYVKMSTMKDGRESPALLTWTDAEAHEALRGHPIRQAHYHRAGFSGGVFQGIHPIS
ncbi:MAG: hypothetical protein ACLR23_17015 [Clostridia bacterium]